MSIFTCSFGFKLERTIRKRIYVAPIVKFAHGEKILGEISKQAPADKGWLGTIGLGATKFSYTYGLPPLEFYELWHRKLVEEPLGNTLLASEIQARVNAAVEALLAHGGTHDKPLRGLSMAQQEELEQVYAEQNFTWTVTGIETSPKRRLEAP